MLRTIKLVTYGSAYPGSMSERKDVDGDYVERTDAGSLAAGLLALVDGKSREADDWKDSAIQIEAQRDEALAALRCLHSAIALIQRVTGQPITLDRGVQAALRGASAIITKHGG